jgi:hypothetical protein
LVKKWTSLVKEEHIALSQYMSAYALKVVLLTLMGDTFNDDKEVLEFRRLYDIVSISLYLFIFMFFNKG